MQEDIRSYLIEGQQAGSRYALSLPRSAPLGSAGCQLGRLGGDSMEFMDHREYQSGDDLRRLDWSAYARSDRMIVKLYRQEVCPHVDILLDGSRSMALEGSGKCRACVGLAAAVAGAAANAGYSHRAYIAAEGCQEIVNSQAEPAAWQGIQFDGVSGVHQSLAALPPRWRRSGMRVLISDLLYMGEPLEMLLAMAHGASAVYVLQVLGRRDADVPRRGSARLVDCETRGVQNIFIDAGVQEHYRRNLSRHQQNWRHAARQAGAVMVSLVAEDLLQDWDLSALMQAQMLTV